MSLQSKGLSRALSSTTIHIIQLVLCRSSINNYLRDGGRERAEEGGCREELAAYQLTFLLYDVGYYFHEPPNLLHNQLGDELSN